MSPSATPRLASLLCSLALALVSACAGEEADDIGGETGESSSTGDGDGDGDGDPTGDGDGDGDPGDGDGDGDGDPFVHEAHTFLTDAGRLAFESNLPPLLTDCLLINQLDVPCEDVDEDGLVDAWEDAVLDRLRPLRRLDEAESLVTDAGAVIGDVGRVAPALSDHFRLFVMLGYSSDYGSCGFTSHNGDSERVAIDLVVEPVGGVGGVRMDQAYTAAHEGTVSDHSQVFAGSDLDQLVIEDDPLVLEPRWVVFPSADKHATYATIDICENISIVPCLDEDCGPDGVMDPAAFDKLPQVVNAGEPAAPRVTDLGVVGFPGDDAWADQDFCGGLGGGSCSSSVRSKLLFDPF